MSQITELHAELEQVKKTITQKQTEWKSYADEPVCSYCGKPRAVITFGGYQGHARCRCTEAVKAFENARKDKAERDALTERQNILERRIENIKLRTEKLKAECNIGRRFLERSFETFNPKGYERVFVSAKEYADTFTSNKGEGLTIIGPVGTGKTHIAVAITKQLMEDYFVPVKFTTSIELFNSLRKFDDDTAIKTLKGVDLLVIDDLGKEKVTEWNREKLFEIVNARYEDYKPIIVTTNCTNNELREQVGEAIYSRLCEMNKAVVMSGNDKRKGVKQ